MIIITISSSTGNQGSPYVCISLSLSLYIYIYMYIYDTHIEIDMCPAAGATRSAVPGEPSPAGPSSTLMIQLCSCDFSGVIVT